MGFLEGLVAGAINGLITSGIRLWKDEQVEERKEEIRASAEKVGMKPDEYVLSELHPSTAALCRKCHHNPEALMEVLERSVKDHLITVAGAQIIWEAHQEEATNAAMERMQILQEISGLAEVLKGTAPKYILEHCDSVMNNRVLLETYLMQCVNNKKISEETAEFLQEQYAKARERTGYASVEKATAAEKLEKVSNKSESVKETTIDIGNDNEQDVEIFMTGRRGASQNKYRKT